MPNVTLRTKRYTKFHRIIEFEPAFDKRNPNPAKNYGIHGVEVRFVLKGDKGAVHFLLFTNWHLPHVQKELDAKPFSIRFPYLHHKPDPADLGFHSPKPMFEGHRRVSESCEYLDGKACYSDSSALASREIYDVLVKEGSDGVWRELEKYYKETFDES